MPRLILQIVGKSGFFVASSNDTAPEVSNISNIEMVSEHSTLPDAVKAVMQNDPSIVFTAIENGLNTVEKCVKELEQSGLPIEPLVLQKFRALCNMGRRSIESKGQLSDPADLANEIATLLQ